MKSILAHCAEARSERLEPGTVLLAEGASPRHRYRPNPPRAPGPSPLETKHLLRDPGDRVHARAIRREVDRRERAPLGLDIVLRFARDSLLEGDGFEPSVPRSRERTSGAISDLQEDNRRRSISQAE